MAEGILAVKQIDTTIPFSVAKERKTVWRDG